MRIRIKWPGVLAVAVVAGLVIWSPAIAEWWETQHWQVCGLWASSAERRLFAQLGLLLVTAIVVVFALTYIRRTHRTRD